MVTNFLDFKYNRMWNEDRATLSSTLINLKMKMKREGLTDLEQAEYDAINRIVERHGGRWLDGIENQ